MGSGIVDFDDYFQGSTTDQKITNMNSMFQAHAGKPTPTVRFNATVYTHTVPIQLWSGMHLIGGGGQPTREYSRHPTLRYTGTISQFRFTGSQTNQSYPSDGSPRDIHVAGIQFSGGASVDCVESVDTYTKGKVAWMTEFHNCGWNGFRRVWHGFVDGGGITGTSHMQAFSDTAVFWRGSEAVLCGNDGFSFVDSSVLGAKPMLRFAVSKGSVGRVMPTTRKDGLALLIDSGSGIRVDGMSCDSQDSDPCYGCNIRIEGNVKGVVITNSTFKGAMSNPTSGNGGVAKNRGIIHVEQGADVIIDGNQFIRQGPNPGPTNTPLVYAGAGVAQRGVRVGLNGHIDYDGVLSASKAGQIVALDPSMTIG